jgi:hypothetical protein
LGARLGSVYRADLSPALFPMGITSVRSGQRLTLGRWPNLDAADAGYSFVDSHSAGGSQITDNQLPAANWTGAIVHIKNIRWSMLDRQVTGASGATLSLNTGLSCLVSGWSNCIGWGYFINNHRATLDQDGEWYYDSSTRGFSLFERRAASYTSRSVVLEEGSDIRHGGDMLSNGSATTTSSWITWRSLNWFNRHRHAGRDEQRHLPPHHRAQRDHPGRGRCRGQPEQLA